MRTRLEFGEDRSSTSPRRSPAARILVVGAGNKRYPDLPNVRYTYTDVILGEGADYVCDLHDLPFPDGSFDAVIAVAVLEHVADPFRCARKSPACSGPAATSIR